VGKLSLLLDGVPLAELTAYDVTFLSNEIGIERERIAMLVQAVKIAEESNLPREALYGLGREDVPLERDTLLEQPLDLLARALNAAIGKNIIPATFSELVDDLMRRFTAL